MKMKEKKRHHLHGVCYATIQNYHGRGKIYNGFSLWFYVPICKKVSPCLYYFLSREKINVQTTLGHNWNIKPGNNTNRQSIWQRKVLKEKLFSLQKQFVLYCMNRKCTTAFNFFIRVCHLVHLSHHQNIKSRIVYF